MDLESECSALESVEDNDVTPEIMAHADNINIKTNGSCANETDNLSSDEHEDSKTMASDMRGDNIEIGQPVNSPPVTTAMSPGVSGGSPPTATKGYGLKKWRRIRRDFVKDASPSVDSSKILKRGLSNTVNPTKPVHLSVETKQKSEGSVESANALAKNLGGADYSPVHGSSSDSRLAVGSAFAAGTDSENSEDRSSKSSTAASAPKGRYDMPAVLGYARDKNKMKNLSGKSLANSVQRVQQGKGRVDTSKKPRGERVKIEKENSHSSVESDSRSSNFVFMQGAFSTVSNGKQSGKSTNYDEENSDEAHASEQQFSEEQTGYSKENVGEVEDSQDDLAADLSWEAKDEKSKNHRSSIGQDPLVESILMLQSVQEALEEEVQKLGELGKEPNFTSTDPEIYPSSSDQLGSEDIRQSDSCSLETQVTSLTQSINSLESKLEGARAVLEAKETRIVELEAILNSGKSLKEESGNAAELQDEKLREVEIELEGLFKRKIEAEVEFVAITRTIQNMRVAAAGDGVTLIEEQKRLVGEQAQVLNKLEGAESKAEMLKKQAEELETYCGDILGGAEVLKMQKRVCKVTSCFFIQLILLVVVCGLFVLQLSPQNATVVPT